jgi:hypothetical protein
MNFFIILIIAFFLSSCGKPKTVLICGDHVCINKKEAEQYFQENLSLEVKIVDKIDKKEIDLVEINLNKDAEGKRVVNITSKIDEEKELKVLSNKEIVKIKKNIKEKEKVKKVVKKKFQKKDSLSKRNIKKSKKSHKKQKELVDICTILEKCSIDEISKYLIKQGKKKNFPNITLRQ